MLIPDPPLPGPIEHISPTLYETLLTCPAKATWSAFGQRDALAPHPAALLGTCFHGVMQAAQNGMISGSADERRADAREWFDRLAAAVLRDSHPLLKVKFTSPEKLPYYNLFRERAAILADEHSSRFQEGKATLPAGPASLAEQRFASSDGTIVGRPDLIDVARSEVVDYKTGLRAEQAWKVSDREARQLKLYAYLASEAGFTISGGRVTRGNGEAATIGITPEAAQAEAQSARKTLAHFNASVDGQSFYDLASPTPDNCQMCPCIPICEPFWRAADLSWREACGTHAEGRVSAVEQRSVQATSLVSLSVEVSRGTLGEAATSIEQVPLSWVTADGDRVPEVGDVIRVVDGRLPNPDDPTVVRADRTMTSLWRVEPGRLP
jgi:hypothetical protein